MLVDDVEDDDGPAAASREDPASILEDDRRGRDDVSLLLVLRVRRAGDDAELLAGLEEAALPALDEARLDVREPWNIVGRGSDGSPSATVDVGGSGGMVACVSDGAVPAIVFTGRE